MSWQDIEPARQPAPEKAAVMVACTKPGRYAQGLRIIVRPELLGGVAWWRPGASVRVQQGIGEHAGKQRLSAAEAGHIVKKSGSRSTQAVLTVVGFGPLPATGIKAAACASEYDKADIIELTLPAWAREPGTRPAATVKAPVERRDPFAVHPALRPGAGARS